MYLLGVEEEAAEEAVVVEAVRSVVLARACSSAFSASVTHISATCQWMGPVRHQARLKSGRGDPLSLLGEVLLALYEVFFFLCKGSWPRVTEDGGRRVKNERQKRRRN